MIRTYSILSTDRELLTSPYVHEIKKKFDIVLTINEPQVVNFLLQFPIDKTDVGGVRAVYNRSELELSDFHTESFKYQTIISATIKPKEIGSLEISLTVPHRHSPSKSWLYADKRKTR